MKEKRKSGFTLAELLIVVAIIAILVAVSIPIFSGKLENARNRTDAYNAKVIGNQIKYAYMTDEDFKAEIDELCSKNKHVVQITVTQDIMVCNDTISKVLKSANLITVPYKIAGRYNDIVCKSTKNWDVYWICISTYYNGFEIRYIGHAVGSSDKADSTALSWTYCGNDPTDFSKMVNGIK